ncbi:SPOR domain-containing protein [Pontixanthobacter aestiaquae]|uniref:SPOR domain-containing protein n=1 Tax=Pontixanthobacter aestiaquae TaxID=1509367 RepID=UPI002E259C46|nr:SPOR domain-containing protein [Pontixanthobacter aestiaquae]
MNTVSQPVVQPLPSPDVIRLNTALRSLSRNSQNVNALIEAGEASLAVGDIDAAIGFFGRAEELSPDNPRIKVGLAGAYVRQQRPIEALALFDAAQAAGASTGSLAGDRALAYDLVGDNSAAMGFYRQALSQNDDAETRRRFALSHAIAGDRRAFEAVLAPLIEKQDFSSYRTRAFGLAILGDEEEAIAIAEAVMPQNLSARISPYLRYMPRLTKAQQAAAANFGAFPRAAQIGRDTPQIAQYTGNNAAARNTDARLAPQGEPLGPRVDTTSPRRRPDRGRSALKDTAQPRGSEARAARITRANRTAASDPSSRTVPPRRVMARRDTPADDSRASIGVPEVATETPASSPPLQAADPAGSKSGELTPREVVTTLPAATVAQSARIASVSGVAPTPIERVDTAPSSAGPSPAASLPSPGFDLAKVAENRVVTSDALAGTPVGAVDAEEEAEAKSVADAFASFAEAPQRRATPTGGVDITKIKPPREVEKKPEPKAEPKAPEHPRRFWVQIATGRDRSALKFDWRRISGKAPDILGDLSPFVTSWGESNRLLAGPYPSAKAARNAMNSLKEGGVDSFTFTSPEGQEIDTL